MAHLIILILNYHCLICFYNHYHWLISIIAFPFIVSEKFQKKVWFPPSNPYHSPRLSAPTSYRITSWSHSETNRGDKTSLTRNEPIFQYSRHGTGTEPSCVVPEPFLHHSPSYPHYAAWKGATSAARSAVSVNARLRCCSARRQRTT